MVTFAIPMVVQVTPLVLRDTVKVLPLREIFTHRFGVEPVLVALLLTVTLPPALDRRCQRQVPPPSTLSETIRELFCSVSRTITPTRVLLPVFCNVLTRATIDPSPLRL